MLPAANNADGTLYRLTFLFKLEAYRFKFLQPSFSSNIFDILDERVPRCQKRVLITLLAALVPSMLKKSIEVKIFFYAKVPRTEGLAMKLACIEYWNSMVLVCLVIQDMDEPLGQAPRLKLITLQRRTNVITTVVRVTTARAIVDNFVRRCTSWMWR